MTISDIPVPEVYKESADFRFFLHWIEICLRKIQYHTDNLIDLMDPLRCPKDLLWMLADSCGYKYDDRASVSFNRLVILYFATLIMYRGSHTGITFAAELNLAQFNLQKYAEENPILADRLEDTSLPTNSTSVTAHPELGYFDLVYYSEKKPVDVCLEYVRPLGMFCFSHSGVAVNARTKVSVDARLTNLNDSNKPGPSFVSHVAHYRRSDYASLQRYDEHNEPVPRNPVYYRNSKYEQTTKPMDEVNPGYRSLYSLQLCNNEHIVKALLPSLEEYDPIFSIGYQPQDVDIKLPDNYLKDKEKNPFNLRIDKSLEESFTPRVYTVETAKSVVSPRPAVNGVMFAFGDAISLNSDNTSYTKVDRETGEIKVIRLRETRPDVPNPVLLSAIPDGGNVVINYNLIPIQDDSYSSVKLAVKKDSIPSSLDDTDLVVVLSTDVSSHDIVILNLEGLTHYYFVLYVSDQHGTWAKSNSIDCITEQTVTPTIDSISLYIPTWDGSETVIVRSGENNTLTVQVSDNHIVFKMYTNDSVIYSWNSAVGSTIDDVDRIHVSFLKDDTNHKAKPSFIYETTTGVYSYNQESPTDSQMEDIYNWLNPSGGN